MTPIAQKSIGVNQTTGLEQIVKIHQINIDAKAEKIVVVYDVDTISPTGVVVATESNKTFERFNGEVNKKFDALRNSPIGQGITALLTSDLDSYPSMDQN